MVLPPTCAQYIDALCPRCGTTHEHVDAYPDSPATDTFLAELRTTSTVQFADAIAPVPIEDAVGFEHLATSGASWVANELVVTGTGRSRTIRYVEGDWIVTSTVVHEPTDEAAVIHHCVCTLASVADPGESIDALPFDLEE